MDDDALLRAMFEHARDGILIADDRRRYVAANPAACAMLGRPLGEVLVLRIEDVMDGPLDRVVESWAAFLELGEMAGITELRRGDGTLKRVDFRARARIRPNRHLSILRDVAGTNELVRRERLARAIASVVSHDADATSLQRALEVVCSEGGWDAAELWLEDDAGAALSRETAVAVDPESRAAIATPAPVFAMGVGLPGIVWASGAPAWWDRGQAQLRIARPALVRALELGTGVAVPVRSGARVIGAFLVLARRELPPDREMVELLEMVAGVLGDRVQRSRAERALRRSRAHLDIVLRQVTEGVAAHDHTGRMVYGNDSALRITRMLAGAPDRALSAQEIMARTTLVDEQGRALAREEYPYVRALAGEAVGAQRLRVRLEGLDEELFLVVSSTPVRDDDGRVALVITTFRDATSEQQAAESRRAEHEARALARALADAADAERRHLATELHDSIGQSLALLKLTVARAAGESAPVGALDEPLRRVDEMIRQIRTMTFELHPAMLHDLGLVPTLERYVEQLRGTSCVPILITETGPRRSLPPAVATDLFRAAKELVTNALKHARPTEIVVAVHWNASRVRLVVDDDGIGFDPSQSRSGLGHESVRRRAEAHGGRLALESGAGAGTRAVVEIVVPEEA